MSRQIILLIALSMACTSRNSTQQSSNMDRVREEPKQFIVRYVKWYNENHNSLNTLKLVSFDSGHYYYLKQEDVEAYLGKLTKSGFFDESYIKSLRGYFKICSEEFRKFPQNDGPPRNLNFDLLLSTQDTDGVFIRADSSKVLYEKKGDGEVTIGIEMDIKLEYRLYWKEGRWLIGEITNLGYPGEPK